MGRKATGLRHPIRSARQVRTLPAYRPAREPPRGTAHGVPISAGILHVASQVILRSPHQSQAPHLAHVEAELEN